VHGGADSNGGYTAARPAAFLLIIISDIAVQVTTFSATFPGAGWNPAFIGLVLRWRDD
jgi:hypothetical protein